MSRLTEDDINTICIHLQAIKEELCNQSRWNEAREYEELIDKLQSIPQWIPVTKRLPKVGQDVIFSVADMYSAEGCLRKDGNWSQFRWSAIISKDRVAAWCELPEPYKR